MDVLIALEHRFVRTPDGATWTPTALARRSWSRYFATFDRVRLLARVQDVPERDPRWLRVDGDGVEVAAVPHYVGPREYLLRFVHVERAVRAALDARPRDAVILRVPGTIGSVAARALRAARRPFGLEVVGDPFDVFAPGASDARLRPFFRWWATWRLRELCAAAATTLYVTSSALQRRYPPAPGARSFAASDVEASDECFVGAPRPADAPAGPPFRIVHVGTFAALYKSPDVLIEAAARCAEGGLDLELVLIGDGRHRGELERLAQRRGIANRVRFTGQLPSGEAVRRELDPAHLFVLPSRQEGMPRALIEAMARGLPCLASPVGGIPELLPESALVPAEPDVLAARIRAAAQDAAWRAEMSRRNLARAREFQERNLQPVRQAFHATLAELTDQRARPRPAASARDVPATVG
jgi:glycosyltransferase involved in cell wall biosynthesis